MADFELPTLPVPPDPPGDGDWGELINAAFETLLGHVNAIKGVAEEALAATGAATDDVVSDLVDDSGSATHASVVTLIPVGGTGHTQWAFGDHTHAAYTTITQVNDAITSALSGAGAILPSGVRVERRAVSGTYPLRNDPETLSAGVKVLWLGAAPPPTTAGYAIAGDSHRRTSS